MASRIAIRAATDQPSIASALLDDALEVFGATERACSRFVPDSPLMRANRAPALWHRVPAELYGAVQEAKRAYDASGGSFDPRVLGRLVALGYDEKLDFSSEAVRDAGVPLDGGAPLEPWQPAFRPATREIRLGTTPIDLGGIGKGLAARWATRLLSRHLRHFLVDASGDCYASGAAPGGSSWRIGVEDPFEPERVIAVLALSDRAIATSSTRHRRWTVGGRSVHHLIDPRTGEPGGPGLVAVTVVGSDPAQCEVQTKALFFEGAGSIGEHAERAGVAACWVTVEGSLEVSSELLPYLEWRQR